MYCCAAVAAARPRMSGQAKPSAAISEKAMTHSLRRDGGEALVRVKIPRRIIGGSRTLHDVSHLPGAVSSCIRDITRAVLEGSVALKHLRDLHTGKAEVTPRSGYMERIAIAMQNGGAGAGARHEAARAARLTSFLSCDRTSMWNPR